MANFEGTRDSNVALSVDIATFESLVPKKSAIIHLLFEFLQSLLDH